MITDVFSVEQLRLLASHPHLIGHLVGKDKLTELHSEWIKAVWLPQAHTALQAHRGGYKTTAVTEIGIIWRLLFHPNTRIALIRETWTESNSTLKTIAQYMQTELIAELFRAMHDAYPRMTTQRDGRLTFNFKASITKEGSVDAYGVDTVPTGSHYDDIITDDVVTIKDRFSQSKRERTKANLQEIMTNILDPGKFLRSVGTPWHKDDAHQVLPDPLKYDCYCTGILSPQQIEEKRTTTTPVMFAANYELTHINDSDALWRDPTFSIWEARLNKVVYAHIDARFSGTHYTALTIMAVRFDGKLCVVGRVFDKDVREAYDEIWEALSIHHVSMMWIENNPDKGYTADLFRRPRRGGFGMMHVEDYHESMNKERKIQTYIAEFWPRLTFAEHCDSDYLAQVMDYRPEQEPDDAPDSLASLLREAIYSSDPETNGAYALYQR